MITFFNDTLGQFHQQRCAQSVTANGLLSLQMVGDVRLCFYDNTQPASVTEVPLWFIDQTIQGVSVGN